MSFIKSLPLRSVTSSTPGKLILFGEHAVVHPYSKMGIATSLSDKRTYLTTSILPEKTDDYNFIIKTNTNHNTVSHFKVEDFVIDPSFNINYSIINDNLLEYIDDFLLNETDIPYLESDDGQDLFKVHRGCFYSLGCISDCLGGVDIFNETNGVRIDMTTQLPIGSGLGSSASLAVALTSSNLKLFDLLCDNPFSKNLRHNDLEAINAWSYVLECIFHGNPSGLDNLISTKGGLIVMKGKEKNIHRIENFLEGENLLELENQTEPSSEQQHEPEENGFLDLLVVNTKVSRSTQLIVENVRKRWETSKNEVNRIFSEIEECSKEFLNLISNSSTTKKKDDEIIKVIRKNQKLLDELGVVGHPKFDQLFGICSKHGFHGYKITGAGGGGSAYVYCENGRNNEVQILRKELEENGFECFQTKDIGGKGVIIEDLF